jgi:hypothetical protein
MHLFWLNGAFPNRARRRLRRVREALTTPAAARLVKFANIRAGQKAG